MVSYRACAAVSMDSKRSDDGKGSKLSQRRKKIRQPRKRQLTCCLGAPSTSSDDEETRMQREARRFVIRGIISPSAYLSDYVTSDVIAPSQRAVQAELAQPAPVIAEHRPTRRSRQMSFSRRSRNSVSSAMFGSASSQGRHGSRSGSIRVVRDELGIARATNARMPHAAALDGANGVVAGGVRHAHFLEPVSHDLQHERQYEAQAATAAVDSAAHPDDTTRMTSQQHNTRDARWRQLSAALMHFDERHFQDAEGGAPDNGEGYWLPYLSPEPPRQPESSTAECWDRRTVDSDSPAASELWDRSLPCDDSSLDDGTDSTTGSSEESHLQPSSPSTDDRRSSRTPSLRNFIFGCLSRIPCSANRTRKGEKSGGTPV